MLVLADRREPWRGLLVPTAIESHAALRTELSALRPHPIVGKWLHLREAADAFEETASRLVAMVLADDTRLGAEPRPRRATGRPRARRRDRRRARAPRPGQ